jgi:hypothetical protein
LSIFIVLTNYKLKTFATAKNILFFNILFLLFLSMPLIGRCKRQFYFQKGVDECQSKLRIIQGLLTHYIEMNQKMPTSEWCDDILAGNDFSYDFMRCPMSKASMDETGYSMNKYIIGTPISKVPKNIVVIFESLPGWNQVGDKSDMLKGIHGEEGSNVLRLKDIRYVPKQEIESLKWQLD